MPLPKDMETCMHKVKDEYPQGRSKKKMTKKKAHKQHVAMCLNTEEYTLPELVGGITLKDFLVAEAFGGADLGGVPVRAFIRNLETWQDLMKDHRAKPEALKIAGQFVKDAGGPEATVDKTMQNRIEDELAHLSDLTYGQQGSMVGDWKGEEEWQRKDDERSRMDQQASDFEDATGQSAETGQALPKAKASMRGGARTGMSFMGDKKAAQAKAQLGAFSGASGSEQASRLQGAQTMAQSGGQSKSAMAQQIFDTNFGQMKPSKIIKMMVRQAGMGKKYATSAYYTMKKKAERPGM